MMKDSIVEKYRHLLSWEAVEEVDKDGDELEGVFSRAFSKAFPGMRYDIELVGWGRKLVRFLSKGAENYGSCDWSFFGTEDGCRLAATEYELLEYGIQFVKEQNDG